jgi:hypothetical protein
MLLKGMPSVADSDFKAGAHHLTMHSRKGASMSFLLRMVKTARALKNSE